MITARSSAAWTIAAHDLRSAWRDGRLRVSGAVLLVLLAVSIASGASYQASLARERTAADAVERQRWLGQGPKNPHGAAHYGIYVFKPASPLALFDRGIDPFVGVATYLEAHKQDPFAFRPAQDRDEVGRFGTLSAAGILQLLLPLLIILAGHGTIAGERERGTLRQVVTGGASRRAVLVGKVAATVGVAVSVLVPTAALAVVVALIAGLPLEPARVGVLAIGYLLYLAGWGALSVAVSALARSARGALLGLLALWLLGCVLGPRLAANIAAARNPVPSAVAYRLALAEDLGDAHSPERAKAVKARLLRQYRVATTAELPFDWRGISLQEGEENGNRVFDRHNAALYSTYAAQDRTLAWSGLLFPQLAIRAISQSASGTDLAHHLRFVNAAERHRRTMQRILNGDVIAHDREGTDYQAPANFWRRIPTFVFAAPRWSDMAGGVAPAIASLALWAAGCAMLLNFAARRVRP